MNENTTNELQPREPNDPQQAPDAPQGTGRRFSRNKKFAMLGGAAAVIGLGAIAAPVVAQTVTGGNDKDSAQHQQFEQDLAQKLGVPQSKVDGALKQMAGDRLGERIDQLQQSGVLTADQAAGIKAKITSGDPRGAMTELRAALTTSQLDTLTKAGTINQDQADQITALVKAGVPIGLRVAPPGASGDEQRPEHVESAAHQKEQVQRLQQAGLITAAQAGTINDLIAANKTADAEQAIHAAMDAGLLTQLVKDGKVTQAQADQITALIAAGAPIGIGGPGMDGPGRHGGPGMDGDQHGGMGMDGDHMGGQPPMDGGQQGQSGGSQSGQFEPQTYGSSTTA